MIRDRGFMLSILRFIEDGVCDDVDRITGIYRCGKIGIFVSVYSKLQFIYPISDIVDDRTDRIFAGGMECDHDLGFYRNDHRVFWLAVVPNDGENDRILFHFHLSRWFLV